MNRNHGAVRGDTMNLVGDVKVTSVTSPNTPSVMPFEM